MKAAAYARQTACGKAFQCVRVWGGMSAMFMLVSGVGISCQWQLLLHGAAAIALPAGPSGLTDWHSKLGCCTPVAAAGAVAAGAAVAVAVAT